MVERVRRALIGLTPDYHLRRVLGPHVYHVRKMKRAELNEAAFEQWPLVEAVCFDWVECGREQK
jgi:hypothetical protein